MATTEEFKDGGASSYTFSIEYIKADDIKVKVDGTALTYTATNPPAQTTEYTVNGSNVILKQASVSGSTTGGVHIYRETALDASDSATFVAGSSIRAADLNANHTLLRYSSQEQNQIITEDDIRDSSITSAKIKDDTIVNADINASANILNSKIADGLLKAGITVNSANIVDGSIVDADVSNSANIQGSKLADDSVGLTKLGSGALPTDITVSRDNIVNGTIQDADIETGTLDNRYYTETELDNGQLDNRYFTESELTGGSLDGRYYTETELLNGGAIDGRYYTEAELNGGQLNNLYFTESEITGGAADGRYYTETELDAGQLDNRYFTETELTGGSLDGRYYTETEAEALFLRQDSSETIASGETWSNSDAKVATTAAINARIIDLVDEVGGFTVIATELVFPNTNPQGATGQAAILSIGALTQGYTRTGTTVTIANGTVAISSGADAPGNRTVTITGVPLDLPSGFGLLVESTATLDEYTFHRLVPKATEVTTVATNITNIVAAGINVADINNFADLYQISGNAPTQRVDGNSLVSGDLWFDNSNGNLRVWDGTAWAIITPAQSVLNDIAIVSGVITYEEDLGLITDPVTTGSSNGSLDIVADALEDEATFTVTASGGAFLIDGVSKPALTLYKGWTYTFDLSDSSNGTHPLRFYAGSSQYSTNVVVTGTQGTSGAKVSIKIPETQPTNFQYYCTNHSGMGNTITVKDDPIKTVSDNVVKIIATADNSSNINAVQANESNINAVAAKATEINRLGTADAVADMALLGTTDVVADMNLLATSDVVADMNLLATSDVISDMNDLATSANITAMSNCSTDISNINTVSANITDVNTFKDRYQIATSNPSTDGGGNALSPGDLFFNSSANELRIWNGTQWQGGVTATGDLSQVSGSTFTGDNKYQDNIKVKFGNDSDLLIFHDTNDSIINEAGTGNLKIQNAGNTKVEVTATGASITGTLTAETIDGTNLTLDFGTL